MIFENLFLTVDLSPTVSPELQSKCFIEKVLKTDFKVCIELAAKVKVGGGGRMDLLGMVLQCQPVAIPGR